MNFYKLQFCQYTITFIAQKVSSVSTELFLYIVYPKTNQVSKNCTLIKIKYYFVKLCTDNAVAACNWYGQVYFYFTPSI